MCTYMTYIYICVPNIHHIIKLKTKFVSYIYSIIKYDNYFE